MNKEQMKEKFNKEHPTWHEKHRNPKLIITPEMLDFIIKNYSNLFNGEIMKELKINQNHLSKLIYMLRAKGIVLKKNMGNFKNSFEESFKEWEKSVDL